MPDHLDATAAPAHHPGPGAPGSPEGDRSLLLRRTHSPLDHPIAIDHEEEERGQPEHRNEDVEHRGPRLHEMQRIDSKQEGCDHGRHETLEQSSGQQEQQRDRDDAGDRGDDPPTEGIEAEDLDPYSDEPLTQRGVDPGRLVRYLAKRFGATCVVACVLRVVGLVEDQVRRVGKAPEAYDRCDEDDPDEGHQVQPGPRSLGGAADRASSVWSSLPCSSSITGGSIVTLSPCENDARGTRHLQTGTVGLPSVPARSGPRRAGRREWSPSLYPTVDRGRSGVPAGCSVRCEEVDRLRALVARVGDRARGLDRRTRRGPLRLRSSLRDRTSPVRPAVATCGSPRGGRGGGSLARGRALLHRGRPSLRALRVAGGSADFRAGPPHGASGGMVGTRGSREVGPGSVRRQLPGQRGDPLPRRGPRCPRWRGRARGRPLWCLWRLRRYRPPSSTDGGLKRVEPRRRSGAARWLPSLGRPSSSSVC